MRLLLLFVLLLGQSDIRRAEPGVPPPPATIEDIAWLAGHWVGEGLGGTAIETISPPVAGQMAGHFQQVNDGRVRFYELYQFVEHERSLLIRMKHFGADLSGWEDKAETIDFALVAIEDGTAWFDGYTFHRVGPDEMEAVVLIGRDRGGSREARFRFRRQPL